MELERELKKPKPKEGRLTIPDCWGLEEGARGADCATGVVTYVASLLLVVLMVLLVVKLLLLVVLLLEPEENAVFAGVVVGRSPTLSAEEPKIEEGEALETFGDDS